MPPSARDDSSSRPSERADSTARWCRGEANGVFSRELEMMPARPMVPSTPEVTDADAPGPPARAAARHDAAAPTGYSTAAAVHPGARAGRAQGAGGEPAPRG